MDVKHAEKVLTEQGSAIGRILVATDLTSIADGTVEFAIDLAHRMHARVELLTVVGHVQGACTARFDIRPRHPRSIVSWRPDVPQVR